MTGTRHRWYAAAAAAAVVAVSAATVWAVLAERDSRPAPRHKAATEQYLPGLAADVYLPPATTAAPVVVLVPGGGWRSADRDGLSPLADALAGQGLVAVNITYRAADRGVRFPVPAQDVTCAVAFAADRARRAGITPRRVVVLGHSAGAHLAALAALAPERFRDGCPYPSAAPDALIGLAGPYNVRRLADVAIDLFGVNEATDPALWRAGNPVEFATARPAVPVLLAHGSHDDTLSQWFTTNFAQALQDGGHRVTLRIVEGATHSTIYSADVIAATVVEWIKAMG